MTNFVRTLLTRKRLLAIFSGLILLLLAFWVVGQKAVKTNGSTTASLSQTLTNQQILKQNIERSFDFPLKDNKGVEVGKFVYQIESGEIKKSIVVKGKVLTAVEGKTFLILNLKLTNELNKNIQLNSRDYIRLSLANEGNEWLAPEVHNDPLEVQAISTKYTRIGFPISESDKNFKIQAGEINGEKTVLDLNF